MIVSQAIPIIGKDLSGTTGMVKLKLPSRKAKDLKIFQVLMPTS
jgi:hypothetical protein